MDILASHGVTAVRLGVMWAGVEPIRGRYNETYLVSVFAIFMHIPPNQLYFIIRVL